MTGDIPQSQHISLISIGVQEISCTVPACNFARMVTPLPCRCLERRYKSFDSGFFGFVRHSGFDCTVYLNL